MPWTVKDVDQHKRGLSTEQKRKWVEIANSVLERCRSEGGGEECEAQAIKIANSQVG